MKDLFETVASGTIIAGFILLYFIDPSLYVKVLLVAAIPGIWFMMRILNRVYAVEIRFARRTIHHWRKELERYASSIDWRFSLPVPSFQ